jgi:Domain of unknown function (DUF6457)
VTRDEWIADFAGRLGAEPPSSEEVEAILDLAAIAAHASERTAAPIACWIAGRTALGLEELRQAARTVDSG